MKKILLVYLPFCTPASPPYSITYLNSFLKNNCNDKIEYLDLNLEFHKLKFPEYQEYYQDENNWRDYHEKTEEYKKITKKVYSENNKKVIKGEKPELFDELLNIIKERKPDMVAFSIVYSSQAFYAYALLKELKDVTKIIGGPAINEKLKALADKTCDNEVELLEFIRGEGTEKFNCDFPIDFSIYNLKEYFTPEAVIPIKTSSTCYYKRCTFCAHFNKTDYKEYPIKTIKKTIIKSKQKHFFLIDDMIHAKRLLEFAEAVKPLKINWTCQLRPTKEFDYETLKKLRESGLSMIMWGVESGNDRILNLIKKGTNEKDIEKVLEASNKAGIKNIVYMMFGFPTETKDEFMQTVEFLKNNEKNIDLVSVSVFGLQKGTEIYNNPQDFGIKKITEEERTVLEPKISYEVSQGLSQKEAAKLRDKHNRSIEKINKYPDTMNFFREHMLCILGNDK